MTNLYRIYADGSAIGNPGPGGWGAIVLFGGKRWELSGRCPSTCISEMELLAALCPLRTLPLSAHVELYSDSEFLIHGMQFHVHQWVKQQWRNRKGRSLQSRAHWEELISLDQSLNIRWRWIKGHNNHPLQSQADRLAHMAARTAWLELKAAA